MGKNPLLAAILSFLLGGVGQLYVRAYKRAGFFLILEAVTGFIYFWGQAQQIMHVELGGQILNLFISIWAAADAYQIAKAQKPKIVKPQQEVYV